MLILHSFIISTITIGNRTSPIVSKILVVGKTGMLNRFRKKGTKTMTSIRDADTAIAPNRILLDAIPVLKIDFLLLRMLNTCTSSEKASVKNAIVF